MNIIVSIVVWILAAAFFVSGCFGTCVSTIAYRACRKDLDSTGVMLALISFLCDAAFFFAAVMLILAVTRG